jgi:leader peptidase (prepilin peptidase) / N-methyltransferase
MPPLLVNIYAFAVGLCIGSFLNVCIYRLPTGKSIVRPPSACPDCGRLIRWYENIPLISYLFLKGRCRGCHTNIALRYPIVELLTGLTALAVVSHFGIQLQSLIYFLFVAALILVTFIDIDHRIIPDSISLPGIPIGFAASFIMPNVSWTDSLLGILLGGGSLLVIAWGYQLIAGKEGMGGGDIKLLAMIGAFLGWKGVLFTIMGSSFIGTLVGLMLMLHARKGIKLAIPFGPFLSIAAIIYIFFGERIIQWYFYELL